MKSMWDIVKGKRKKYYGSSKAVYRLCDMEMIMRMRSDYSYVLELLTRCRLVPCNEEFIKTKGIPHYNACVKKMKEKYPDILEFQLLKPIPLSSNN